MSYFQDLVDELMKEQADKSSSNTKRELAPGDVIGIFGKEMKRYGIYLGDDKIVHCVGPSTEQDSNEVAVSSLSLFLEGQGQFSILNFERFNQDLLEKNGRYILSSPDSPGGFEVRESSERPFLLFSAEETISRALSRLTKKDGKLQIDDCHHFFCWAKTGSKDCSPILMEKYWDVIRL